jgi:hypothetical protein
VTRHLFIFLGTFLVGALLTLGARTAAYRPGSSTPITASGHGEHLPLAPLTPKPEHNNHSPVTTPEPAKPSAGETVNSVCAICGMSVDPSLPTLEYQGKKIGFGCKMCAPKFKGDPDKYGPLYLRNEVLKR